MAITRKVKRQGSLWIRVFPDKPVTKKPLEVRMGSGKGAVEQWVAVIKPGRVMFELAGVPRKRRRTLSASRRQSSRSKCASWREESCDEGQRPESADDGRPPRAPASIKKELFGNRMKNFTNQLDDTSQINKARRDLARIAGILGERTKVAAAGGAS